METIETKTSWLADQLNLLDEDYRKLARAEIKKKFVWSKQMLNNRLVGNTEISYSEGMTVQKIVKKLLKAQNTTV